MIAAHSINDEDGARAAVSFATFIVILLACMAAAGVTEFISSLTDGEISIWLPTGFVMAAMAATRPSRWPFWALAAAMAEGLGNVLWYHHAWPPAALLITGNLVAAFSGAWLIRRIVGETPLLCTIRNTGVFLSIALLVMPLISATLCSLALGWSYGRQPFAEWPRVFLGDATGAVIAAPLALLFFGVAAGWPRMNQSRWIESGMLTIVFLTLTVLTMGSYFPFMFVMLVPTLWAALRFRVVGAIVVSSALALFASLLTAANISPFGASALYGQYGPQGLQIFLMIVSASSLMVGAIAEEHRTILRRLHDSNRTLESRVTERSALLAASELRANETSRLLEAIGEACPDLIFAKDTDLKLIYANAATLAVLGKDGLDAAIGLENEAIIPFADEAAIIRRNDEQVLKTGQTLIVEEPVTVAPNEVRIYRATKAPLLDSNGTLVGLAGVCVDITQIKKSAARERMLVREIEHRARNLLAVLQSIIQLTEAASIKDFRTAISRRLQALARTHASISEANWEGASLLGLLRDECAPYIDRSDDRVAMSGEDLFLDTGTAQSLALMFHEMATNAAKYGALSVASGRIDVNWEVEVTSDGRQQLIIDWRESGGPHVTEPTKLGFGSTVISMLSQERDGGKAEYHWEKEGLFVRIVQPIENSETPIAG